jgi:hypothetical protein
MQRVVDNMPAKRNNRERMLYLFVGVLVLGAAYIILLSTGIIEVDGSGFTIDGIEADTVVLRHEAAATGDNSVVYSMVTLTDPHTVRELLHIRNTALVRSTHKSRTNERYALFFYQEDEMVELWRIYTSGVTTFSNRSGTFIFADDDFDLRYIIGLLR